MIKLVLSVAIVVGLAEISKRFSPQIAGILSGLPLGTGLSVYFISYEQGVDFAVEGIPWGIAGLSGAICLCVVYLLVSRIEKSANRLLAITKSSLASISAYLVFGYLLYLLKLDLLQAMLLFASVFFVNLLLIKKLIQSPEKTIKDAPSSTWKQILVRGVIVGVILLSITGVASIAGSKWAGVLSSFPLTLFPLLLVLHYDSGRKLFPSVILGYSYSISTLLCFYLGYICFVPLYGLIWGFVIVYVICTIYLYCLRKLQVVFQ